MARPARHASEGAAVLAAADTLRPSLSVNARAKAIAAQVAADVIGYLDLDTSDPLLASLAELQRITDNGPIATLARSPEIDTCTAFVERRVELYRSRHGRQLSERERDRETAQIVAEMTERLALRYSRYLRK